MVKIDFEFDSEYGIFRDAICLPDDHGLSDAQLETLKRDRFDNWLLVVKQQSGEIPPALEG